MGEGRPPFHYIEVLDIDDYDAYLAALTSPSAEIAGLIEQASSYVDDRTMNTLVGEIVE